VRCATARSRQRTGQWGRSQGPTLKASESIGRVASAKRNPSVTATLESNYALTNLDRMLAGSVSRKLSNQGVSFDL
jgi:hypothetical protein